MDSDNREQKTSSGIDSDTNLVGALASVMGAPAGDEAAELSEHRAVTENDGQSKDSQSKKSVKPDSGAPAPEYTPFRPESKVWPRVGWADSTAKSSDGGVDIQGDWEPPYLDQKARSAESPTTRLVTFDNRVRVRPTFEDSDCAKLDDEGAEFGERPTVQKQTSRPYHDLLPLAETQDLDSDRDHGLDPPFEPHDIDWDGLLGNINLSKGGPKTYIANSGPTSDISDGEMELESTSGEQAPRLGIDHSKVVNICLQNFRAAMSEKSSQLRDLKEQRHRLALWADGFDDEPSMEQLLSLREAGGLSNSILIALASIAVNLLEFLAEPEVATLRRAETDEMVKQLPSSVKAVHSRLHPDHASSSSDSESGFDSALEGIVDLIDSLYDLEPYIEDLRSDYAGSDYGGDLVLESLTAEYKRYITQRDGWQLESRLASRLALLNAQRHQNVREWAERPRAQQETISRDTDMDMHQGTTSDTTGSSFAESSIFDQAGSVYSASSVASSVADGGEQVRYPKAPLPEFPATTAHCTICHDPIVAIDTRKWKAHVREDLQPYICLENSCPEENAQFGSAREWQQHDKEYHRNISGYACIHPCSFACPERGGFQQHILDDHLKGQTSSSPPDLEHLVTCCAQYDDTTVLKQELECAFCGETRTGKRAMRRYTGRHMVELALKALPQNFAASDSEDQEKTDNDSDISEVIETEGHESDVSEHIADSQNRGSTTQATEFQMLTDSIDGCLLEFHTHLARCRPCSNPILTYERREPLCDTGTFMRTEIIRLLYLTAEYTKSGKFTVEVDPKWQAVDGLIRIICHNKQGEYTNTIIDLKRRAPPEWETKTQGASGSASRVEIIRRSSDKGPSNPNFYAPSEFPGPIMLPAPQDHVQSLGIETQPNPFFNPSEPPRSFDSTSKGYETTPIFTLGEDANSDDWLPLFPKSTVEADRSFEHQVHSGSVGDTGSDGYRNELQEGEMVREEPSQRAHETLALQTKHEWSGQDLDRAQDEDRRRENLEASVSKSTVPLESMRVQKDFGGWQCDVCRKIFTRKADLFRHMWSSHSKKYSSSESQPRAHLDADIGFPEKEQSPTRAEQSWTSGELKRTSNTIAARAQRRAEGMEKQDSDSRYEPVWQEMERDGEMGERIPELPQWIQKINPPPSHNFGVAGMVWYCPNCRDGPFDPNIHASCYNCGWYKT